MNWKKTLFRAAGLIISPVSIIEKGVGYVKENIQEDLKLLVTKVIKMMLIFVTFLFFLAFISLYFAHLVNDYYNNYAGYVIMSVFYLFVVFIISLIGATKSGQQLLKKLLD